MREIKYIVLHCTATDQDAKVDSIVKYWKERMDWKNPGYHFIIDKYGRVRQLQPLGKPSNGVRGYNSNSIHISYIGGKDEDDRTSPQKLVMEGLVKSLHSVFPNAEILGHRDFPGVSKSCPNFDVKEFLKEIEL